MRYFSIKYVDEIQAETMEEAIKKLLKCLASDVEHSDVDAFIITDHGQVTQYDTAEELV